MVRAWHVLRYGGLGTLASAIFVFIQGCDYKEATIALLTLLLLGIPSCFGGGLSREGIHVTRIQNIVDGTGVLIGNEVTFTVSLSEGGSATAFIWNFGDGASGSGKTVSHRYTGTGTFVVTVVVTRRNGAQDTFSTTLALGATTEIAPRLFVLNDNQQLDIIDLDTTTVTASIGVNAVEATNDGAYPHMAITPDGARMYVIHYTLNSVTVMDLVNHLNLGISIAVGNNPSSITIHPDGTRAYVTNGGDETVSVIDLASNAVVDTITLGAPQIEPILFAIHPNGTTAYTFNQDSATISIIDLNTNTVVGDFDYDVGSNPDTATSMVISPDGTRAYASMAGGNFTNSVLVLDLVNNTLLTTIPTPATNGLFDLALSPDGTRAYVTAVTDNLVHVINLNTNSVIASIPTGSAAIRIAISADGTRGYVTNFFDNDVSVLDLTNNTNLNSDIPVAGNNPFMILIQD